MKIAIQYAALAVVLFALVGFIIGNFLRKWIFLSKERQAESQAALTIKGAEKEAEAIKRDAVIQAKDIVCEARLQFDKEFKQKNDEVDNLEKKLLAREDGLEKRLNAVSRKEEETSGRENRVADKERALAQEEAKCQQLVREQQNRLEQLAEMSAAEAKNLLLASMEEEARAEATKIIRAVEEEARAQADKKAKDILATALQRYAGEVVSEKTVCVVNLPNDEMKGRIIGREGRNIRAIEAATGMDVIIDDTPEAVILSGFNPLRREIARISLERLISDGRIHPARIEEVVEKAAKEMESAIKEAGEQAAFDVGIFGLHPELVMLLGKLKYRMSYGQNCLAHSQEVAFMCGIMAAELGVSVKQAKRAGLLHDIGKAVDHEVEGSHAIIGADLARKYGESVKVVQAIAAHHEEEKPESIIAVLINTADTLSAARPGARREMYETYIQRVKELERLATSFKGVNKAYAIHAGREVRVIVEPNEINEGESLMLAREMAKKIESDLTYPGQVKVTVIRETRAVEHAR